MRPGSEAAGRAARPGRAPGPASLGASWEQLVALGQSDGAASPASAEDGDSPRRRDQDVAPSIFRDGSMCWEGL